MNFRVVLDGAVILTLIFYGGVGWQKITMLERAVATFSAMDSARSGTAERLARIEEKVDRLSRDIDRIMNRLDGD
jgi:hypothetical protein